MTAPDARLCTRPPIAWPTVALAAAALTGWLATSIAALAGAIPLGLGLAVNVVMAYIAFTPTHDAAHRAVSRYPWINEAVGFSCALVLVAPFAAFRHVHLEHHKHTNDPDLDPDHWSGRGPDWLLPLRWLTQDLHYYPRYLAVILSKPWSELLAVAAFVAVVIAALVTAAVLDALLPVILLWVVPSRVAIAALAFCLDYLPHRPHTVRGADDRYRATRVFAGRGLTPLFLYQNYHLVHHLYPAVPFYRLGRLWRARRDQLVARGARVVHVGAGE